VEGRRLLAALVASLLAPLAFLVPAIVLALRSEPDGFKMQEFTCTFADPTSQLIGVLIPGFINIALIFLFSVPSLSTSPSIVV